MSDGREKEVPMEFSIFVFGFLPFCTSSGQSDLVGQPDTVVAQHSLVSAH